MQNLRSAYAFRRYLRFSQNCSEEKIKFMKKLNSEIILFSLILLYPISLVLFFIFSDCSPYEISLDRVFLPPSFKFPLGTNSLGQDIACMIGRGIITSFKVALPSAFISFFVGGVLGAVAGFFGGIYDFLVGRLIEFFQSFPSLIFIIFVVAVFTGERKGVGLILGDGDLILILSICVFGWTSFGRIARAEAMKLRGADFILSAIVLGVGRVRLIFRYILPFILPGLATQLMFSLSSFVLIEGSLGFLGLRPSESVSLGAMISDGMDFILTRPEQVVFPGMALSCISVFFNLIGQRFLRSSSKKM